MTELILNKPNWLLIDDVRELGTEAIARTPALGKKFLALGGWDCVCFDHDLGMHEETGYDVMKWAIQHNFLPDKVQLVTSNPVGRANMQAALVSAGFSSIDGINYKRK